MVRDRVRVRVRSGLRLAFCFDMGLRLQVARTIPQFSRSCQYHRHDVSKMHKFHCKTVSNSAHGVQQRKISRQ